MLKSLLASLQQTQLPELSRDEMHTLTLLARGVKAGLVDVAEIELHRKKGTLRLHVRETHDCES